MLRIICKYYPKAYKSPQTKVSFIIIGHSSSSFVVFLQQCVNTRWQNVTVVPFCLCCYGLRYGNVWTGG